MQGLVRWLQMLKGLQSLNSDITQNSIWSQMNTQLFLESLSIDTMLSECALIVSGTLTLQSNGL